MFVNFQQLRLVNGSACSLIPNNFDWLTELHGAKLCREENGGRGRDKKVCEHTIFIFKLLKILIELGSVQYVWIRGITATTLRQNLTFSS